MSNIAIRAEGLGKKFLIGHESERASYATLSGLIGSTVRNIARSSRDIMHSNRLIAGDNVEAAIAHFQAKVDKADPENEGTRPAEVLVNLLLRLERPEKALAVARRHLASVNSRPLGCPSIVELCQRTKNYRVLADVAREQGDLVHFVAGLVAEKQPQ